MRGKTYVKLYDHGDWCNSFMTDDIEHAAMVAVDQWLNDEYTTITITNEHGEEFFRIHDDGLVVRYTDRASDHDLATITTCLAINCPSTTFRFVQVA